MSLISYKNVNIYQETGELTLEKVHFHVDEGEFIYLIGRVGSGKSSLLKTLYLELDIDEADEAVVLGQNIIKLRRKHVPPLRRKMGIIFQDFKLLNEKTVYENLKFVLKATGWKKKDAIDKRIEEVLSDVGMSDKMNSRGASSNVLPSHAHCSIRLNLSLQMNPLAIWMQKQPTALWHCCGRFLKQAPLSLCQLIILASFKSSMASSTAAKMDIWRK